MSAGYSVIATRTGWLKYYHPREFWTSTLNSVLGKADKLTKYIAAAAEDSIKVLPPSVNLSYGDFEEDGESIRMGLKAIKHVGKSSLVVIEERKKGPYKSLADFIRRISPNQGIIEALALSGALDDFGFSRKAIIVNMPKIVKFIKDLKKYNTWADTDEIDEWYASLLDLDIEDCPEFNEHDKLENEYKYAGMYITGHPLDQYQPIIKGLSHADIDTLVIEKDELDDDEDDDASVFEEVRNVVVVGILKEVESKTTRKGDTMFVGRIEDKTGSIKVTVFPKNVEDARFSFIENNIVVLSGTWKHDSYGSQIIEDSVTDINSLQLSNDATLFVLVDQHEAHSITEEIANRFAVKNGEAGPLLCVRALTTHGTASIVYDTKKKSLVAGRFREIRMNPNNLRVRVSMSSFMAIREMVKDITVVAD